jgi:hypothetical protein
MESNRCSNLELRASCVHRNRRNRVNRQSQSHRALNGEIMQNTKTPFFSFFNKPFVNKIFTVICISGLIGFSLGFLRYLGNTYYLPVFPNIFDCIFIASSALYLGYRGLKK